MSRGKRAGAKRHRRAEPRSPLSTRPGAEAPGQSRAEQLASARRRVSVAKTLFGVVGALVFGIVMVFARQSYAGHPKHPATPLTAPPRFVSVVRQNLLQAGIVAPAQAPPGASTSVS
jgi:hypothetical protein